MMVIDYGVAVELSSPFFSLFFHSHTYYNLSQPFFFFLCTLADCVLIFLISFTLALEFLHLSPVCLVRECMQTVKREGERREREYQYYLT